MRLPVRLALVVVLWLLAWGEVSPANVVSGIAVGAALFVVFPLADDEGERGRISAAGVARLLGYILVQLVLSNLVMARSIVRRRPAWHPGVVAHRLDQPSELTATMMTSIIALSPGTMTVDVDDDASSIQVHFFDLLDVEAARLSLARLEQLVTSAVRPIGSAT